MADQDLTRAARAAVTGAREDEVRALGVRSRSWDPVTVPCRGPDLKLSNPEGDPRPVAGRHPSWCYCGGRDRVTMSREDRIALAAYCGDARARALDSRDWRNGYQCRAMANLLGDAGAHFRPRGFEPDEYGTVSADPHYPWCPGSRRYRYPKPVDDLVHFVSGLLVRWGQEVLIRGLLAVCSAMLVWWETHWRCSQCGDSDPCRTHEGPRRLVEAVGAWLDLQHREPGVWLGLDRSLDGRGFEVLVVSDFAPLSYGPNLDRVMGGSPPWWWPILHGFRPTVPWARAHLMRRAVESELVSWVLGEGV